jgi:hypothetical protein
LKFGRPISNATRAALLLVCGAACAQQAPGTATPPQPAAPADASKGQSQIPGADAATKGTAVSHAMTTAPTGRGDDETAVSAPGVLVDQVIVVVNGDLILESDVDEERRMAAFQPIGEPLGSFSRKEAVDRLIDRALILQQAKLQPEQAVTQAEVDGELAQLRQTIPACRQYHCETDEGWKKFVEAQGLTLPELNARWKERMQILKFIEMRFRMGIRIEPAAIKTYYEKTLLPEYAKQNAAAPPLESISGRIQEVLLQQQVTNLLDDWLESLKAEGSVRFMKPGEVKP